MLCLSFQLQTLQKEFGDYMKFKNLTNIVLCTEDLDVVECSLIIRGPPKNSVKIGAGWKKLCHIARYQKDDVLRFKFSGRLSPNLIHVIRLET
jgi:hypothetical protein